ncbi:class I SAM-dependent rRNA methyltransferase [Patiriisocius hiemis]|uniref:Class I SAM-dependent rRNA methyltransferase n=1 Tax=Patiriisocius hiemis TaxID=3075604 RepID=A0ABU2Y9H3_9FLAO|nr:class I SAM-dependent rRNA methyltransferase [Constantimarinum sp. W242]MDT0554829.1 class I SAM-dependent rRNA methyltransferase [Constantimarinum sp. W242]
MSKSFNITFPEYTPQRLAIKLNAAGERSVRNGHPWIFSDSIIKLNKEGQAGDLAIIFSYTKNEVIGIGLYDPESPIRIKLLHHNNPATINEAFFEDKIARAYSLRAELLDTKTNSYRLLFGENDGFPSLIADVYASVLVIKVYSAIWLPYLKTIINQLISVSEVETVVMRLSRKLQNYPDIPFKDGAVLHGELPSEEISFKEHGVNFKANVIKGHKTGYFLDHRHNRKRVGVLSKGKKVLDVFSYAGGFSVHALAQGAKEVTSIDISSQALEIAKENTHLNSFNGTHKTVVGDAFEILKNLVSNGEQYDIVIIDPPSFAKSQKEIIIANKKYRQLAQFGSMLTAKGGMLVLASCSSRVTTASFFEINAKAISDLKIKYDLTLKTAHDIDHPVTFKEGSYLKCGYYKIM